MIAGLGGRSITRESLRAAPRARPGATSSRPLNFLDLDTALVERELARDAERPPAGPHAENMLRDLGVVAAEPH